MNWLAFIDENHNDKLKEMGRQSLIGRWEDSLEKPQMSMRNYEI